MIQLSTACEILHASSRLSWLLYRAHLIVFLTSTRAVVSFCDMVFCSHRLTSEGQNWGVIEAEKVITMIDDFSLPFCELKLQMLFNCESNDEIKSDIVNAVFNAAVADPGAKRSHWVDLVALLSQDAVRQVRDIAVLHCTVLTRTDSRASRERVLVDTTLG